MSRSLPAFFDRFIALFTSAPSSDDLRFPYAEAIVFFCSLILFLNFLPQHIFAGMDDTGAVLLLTGLIVFMYGIALWAALRRGGAPLCCRKLLFSLAGGAVTAGAFLYFSQVMAYYGSFSIKSYAGAYGFLLGTEVRDNLFHSALIESVVNFGYPSALYVEPSFFRYHTGIHYLLAGICRVSGISALSALHYVYPLLILPLFTGLVLKFTAELKHLLRRGERLNFPDLFLLCVAVLGGFLVVRAGYVIGICVPTMYLSVSMGLGWIVMLFTGLITLRALRGGLFARRWFSTVYWALILPALLIAGTIAKITAGLLILGTAAIYFVSRKNTTASFFRGIVVVALYAALFAAIGLTLAVGEGGAHPAIVPFAFLRSTPFSLIGMVIMLVPAAAYLHFSGWSPRKIFGGGQVAGNMVLGLTVAFWIPPLVWEIDSGSDSFFYMLPFMLSVMACCAQDVPMRIMKMLPEKVRRGVALLLGAAVIGGTVLSAVYCVYPAAAAPVRVMKQAAKGPVYGAVSRLRKFLHEGDAAKKTIAYMDVSSPLISAYPNGSGLMVQALLGIPVLNSLQRGGDGLYAPCIVRKGGRIEMLPLPRYASCGYGYGIREALIPERPLGVAEARQFARTRGYRYFAEFSRGIRLVDLERGEVTELCPAGQEHLFLLRKKKSPRAPSNAAGSTGKGRF